MTDASRSSDTTVTKEDALVFFSISRILGIGGYSITSVGNGFGNKESCCFRSFKPTPIFKQCRHSRTLHMQSCACTYQKSLDPSIQHRRTHFITLDLFSQSHKITISGLPASLHLHSTPHSCFHNTSNHETYHLPDRCGSYGHGPLQQWSPRYRQYRWNALWRLRDAVLELLGCKCSYDPSQL